MRVALGSGDGEHSGETVDSCRSTAPGKIDMQRAFATAAAHHLDGISSATQRFVHVSDAMRLVDTSCPDGFARRQELGPAAMARAVREATASPSCQQRGDNHSAMRPIVGWTLHHAVGKIGQTHYCYPFDFPGVDPVCRCSGTRLSPDVIVRISHTAARARLRPVLRAGAVSVAQLDTGYLRVSKSDILIPMATALNRLPPRPGQQPPVPLLQHRRRRRPPGLRQHSVGVGGLYLLFVTYPGQPPHRPAQLGGAMPATPSARASAPGGGPATGPTTITTRSSATASTC